MRVGFTVKGRPPKKHGEKSMWARNDEAPRITSLREKALEARMELGLPAEKAFPHLPSSSMSDYAINVSVFSRVE